MTSKNWILLHARTKRNPDSVIATGCTGSRSKSSRVLLKTARSLGADWPAVVAKNIGESLDKMSR